MRLAMRDISAREHEAKPVEQADPAEHVMGEVGPAARRHAPRQTPLHKILDERHRPRHRLKP